MAAAAMAAATVTVAAALTTTTPLGGPVERVQCDQGGLPKLDPPDVVLEDDDDETTTTTKNKATTTMDPTKHDHNNHNPIAERYAAAAAAQKAYHQTSSSSHSMPIAERYAAVAAAQRRRLDPSSPTDEWYHDLFPLRQKWQPKLDYPLWDSNWDGLKPQWTASDTNDDTKRRILRDIRKKGVTRHIVLVRHGQYDETHAEDHLRTLTPLGRRQAELTGQRLASLLQQPVSNYDDDDNNSDYSDKKQRRLRRRPLCRITKLRVSNMTRAIETADIIAKYLPLVPYEEPDPLLNEGRPCHHIPGSKVSDKVVQQTDEHHPRIEKAFQKYFYRAPMPIKTSRDGSSNSGSSSSSLNDQPVKDHATTRMEKSNNNDDDDDDDESQRHEFEIIVCHANVIRYFLCRALQLPPEVWLRYCPFNCSLTYITIRPTGNVSCRLMGDIGHLPYEASTFSQHEGFVW
ncbi:hypothetical protein ACA910_018804 [Epithemia clementina (nom. ined.)]